MHRSLLESLAPGKPPLRIGLLLDSRMLPRFLAEIINQIAGCEFAKIELLIVNSSPGHLRFRHAGGWLYSIYDRYLSGAADQDDDPLGETDCTAKLSGIESLSVAPAADGTFPASAIEAIRSKNLDVILRLGFHNLKGEILHSARFGMWSYHHGDPDFYRGGPACFWEVYERNPITGAVLQVVEDDEESGQILAKGYFTTDAFSHTRNRVAPFWGTSTFVIQKLRELHGRGWDFVEAHCVPREPYRGKRDPYRPPTTWDLTRWLIPALTKKTLRRLTTVKLSQLLIPTRFKQAAGSMGGKPVVPFWRMAIATGGKPIEDLTRPASFVWLDCPRGHFYADPFFFQDPTGKLWLFFEDYDYSVDRGKLVCAEFKDGKMGAVIDVLVKPYHLSYPHVFQDGDTIYMIPECQANNTVDLYKAIEFPHTWEHVRVLYEGAAVDTTVWKKDGLWYFFTALKEARGDAMQLWIFCADSPEGRWRPHPASPVSTDVRNSRGAGAIFQRNGRLFRPSQDCGITYGYSFSLNEILVLTPDEYKEKCCVTIEPVWANNLAGTHSYAQFGNIEIVDGLQYVSAASQAL